MIQFETRTHSPKILQPLQPKLPTQVSKQVIAVKEMKMRKLKFDDIVFGGDPKKNLKSQRVNSPSEPEPEKE